MVSVLESMRSGTDSTLMQVVLVLVVVSFIFWYAAPQGDTTQVVFTVNGQEVRDIEFNKMYSNAVRAEEVRTGNALSEPQQAALRQQVRDQLIESTVVMQQAEELGIEVSDTEVARRIYSYEVFHDADGKFDERVYDNQLRRMRYSQSDFEDRVRKDVLREKVRGLVALGGTASRIEVRSAWEEANTTVDVQYVSLRPSAFYDRVEITDDIRAAWLGEHEARVREVYEADFQRLYDLPDRVRLDVIRLGVRSDGVPAEELANRLRTVRGELVAGGDFAALARRHSEDPSAGRGGDLGVLSVADLAEPVRQALEGVDAGQLTEVVVESGQVRLFRVTERLPARQVPFEEVRDEIADRLIRDERAPTVAAEYADRVHARWKELGSAPTELLSEVGLTAVSTGPRAVGAPAGFSGPPEQMMGDAQNAASGAVLPEIYTQGTTLYVGQLTSRVDPDPAAFEDQRANLTEAVLSNERREFLRAYIDASVASAVIE